MSVDTERVALLRVESISSMGWRIAVLAIVVFGLVAVACGEDSEDSPTPTSESVDPEPAPTSTSADSSPPEDFDTQVFDGLGDTPGFAGLSFNQGVFDTRELQGKPLVINFWFPSCPPCRAELPVFEEVYQEFGPPGGGDVHFVGIQQLGLDSIDDGIELFNELGVTFPSLPDTGTQVQIKYDIFSFPTTVFLDRNHNEVRKWQGAVDHDTLLELVEQISETTTSSDFESGDTAEVAAIAEDMEDTVEDVVEREFDPPDVFAGLGDTVGFSGETFKHGMFNTNELEGRPIVVNFWYPSCPPCRGEIPNFEHAYQKYGDPGGGEIVFIGIQALFIDSAAKGEEFMEDMKANYPVMPDVNGEIHVAFQITSAPTTFFLDRDHNIVGVHQGYMRHDELTEMLEFLTKPA